MANIVIGDTYNHFTVIRKLQRTGANAAPYYLCQCTCGNEKEVRKDNIGKTQSCGCVRNHARKKRTAKSVLGNIPIKPVEKHNQTPKPIPVERIASGKNRRSIEEFNERRNLERELDSFYDY